MKEEIVEPSVQLFDSLRSIGYSFESAVADLIDNSISAGSKTIEIYADVVDGEYITILDDGVGMDADTAREALRFAGTAGQKRTTKDLGKFGLGLKTASLSQARTLTVVSKTKVSLIGLRWDLDYVVERGVWALQVLNNEEIEETSDYDKLKSIPSGTLIEWKNLDLFLGDTSNPGEHIANRLESLRHELGLVFHRFIEDKSRKLTIRLNGSAIKAIDPFLKGSNKVQPGHTQPLRIGESVVKITPFTLPHPKSLTPDERRRSDLNNDLRDTQGFYVYRNRRLISRGHWFGVTAKSELSKLTRIQVDVPPELDHLWQLDVKKSRTDPPASFKQKLREAITPILGKSHRVFEFKARKAGDQNILHVWSTMLDENGFRYEINVEHPIVQNFLSSVDASQIQDCLKLFRLIEETYPFDDAYHLMASGISPAQLDLNEFLPRMIEVKNQLLQLNYSRSDIEQMLRVVEPYSQMNQEQFRQVFNQAFEGE